MFELAITRDFSAAHNLRGYHGNCERLHGHNWKVEIVIKAERLNDLGMVVDFREAEKVSDEALAQLDHTYLNELAWFREANPTTENIAQVLFNEISSRLPDGLQLARVKVWESENCAATFTK